MPHPKQIMMMTIYTFLSQNLKPSIVASSPGQLLCSIYFEKEKRKLSLP